MLFDSYSQQYNLIHNQIAKANRLESLLIDVYTIRACDFVVCTHSSNVCRLVYELMQIDDVNPTWRVASLDSDYFLNGERRYEYAVQDHRPENGTQLALEIGDIVVLVFLRKEKNQLIFYNSLGFKKGYNLRTKRTGFYPAFKTSE
jgi:hypothetical protein